MDIPVDSPMPDCSVTVTPHHKTRSSWKAGFTLIEMSIVLVVIGLIVGGILVGQDLIRSAGVRAQVSQIEKYNTATNTFREKYGYLPGDINAVAAAQFGFASRGSNPGEGDGNGVIEATQCGGAYPNSGSFEATGESPMVWTDLSKAGLIEGGFKTASAYNGLNSDLIGASVSQYFPPAAIGQNNYVYVWSGGTSGVSGSTALNGINYWGLSVVSKIQSCGNGGQIYWDGNANSNDGLTVAQAYAIDNKMDDGLPGSGRVRAMGLIYGNEPGWSGIGFSTSSPSIPDGWSQPITSTTCFDNAGNTGALQQYSITKNHGTGINCALSFQFQAGD